MKQRSAIGSRSSVIGRRWSVVGLRLSVLGVALAACAHGDFAPLTRPEFPAPRSGVFNTPLPVVENTDDDMMPSLAHPTGLIAYVSKQGGNLDIFVRSQATGLVRRLTTHSADDVDPAFSPDGKRIAWVAQSDDVKGDVWIMNNDGEDKTRFTERDAAESSPAWSADGKTIYFTTRIGTGALPRIDALELDSKKRGVAVADAWDPAPAPDGSSIVYVAADTTGLPRLYAKRASDGRVTAITDGTCIDALPRFAMLDGRPTVVFTRFVDDSTGDGRVTTDDEASLWAVAFNPSVFDGAPVPAPRPLTPGAGGELLAAIGGNWLAYTAAGYADLEIYALPSDGMVERNAAAGAVLEAARAEPDAALRRLALRHVMATSPALEGRARYELGRDLTERGKLAEARTELGRAVTQLANDDLQGVAAIEIERVAVLQALGGTFDGGTPGTAKLLDDAGRSMTAIAQAHTVAAVWDRLATSRAELDLARGKLSQALAGFEALAARPDVSSEDGARALDHASSIYARFTDADAVERVCAALLTRFSAERRYVDRCAVTWLEAAKGAAAGDATAAFEDIVRRYEKLPAVAAPAMYALGHEQAEAHPNLAIASWQLLVGRYPTVSATVADALIALGETAEQQGQPAVALRAYEQLLAQFGSDPRTRGRARAGATRIALAKADSEEKQGQLEAARDSYARLLERRRDNALAHRRFIALSARLGKAKEVIAGYAAGARARPRDAIARYAYGYALTFATPLELSPSERELGAALDLDPRFAAAHLTLGWTRMQREQRSPGRDWLDRAESSFRTALELVSPEEDPQLWAAAQLNRANALLGLGKNDDAFAGFLARNGSSARFEDNATELLFYESFARAAWRMDELDVALDMAHQEWLLAQRLPEKPRLATAAALQASIYLQAGLYDDAVAWYQRAEAIYRERRDWTRVVPMLRGKALALRALARDDDALNAFADLLDLTGRGIGVPAPDKPFLAFLAPEIPANPTNVTRAPYGFTASEEEEVARAAAARALREHGDLSRARTFADRRLALIDEAMKDESMAARIQPELVHALNETALLHAQAGNTAKAMELWGRALGTCQDNGYVAEAITILESLSTSWAREPQSRDAALATRARALANAMAQQAAADPQIAARLSRWLALERFAGVLAPLEPTQEPRTLAGLINELDGLNGELDDVIALASDDSQLSESLRSYTGGGGTQAAPEAAPADDFMGPPAALSETTAASWRTAFDSAAAGAVAERAQLSLARLAPAIAAYETYGGGRAAPERRTFLDVASRLLIAGGETERAWRLLERSRLEDLQPGTRRRAAVLGRLAKRPLLKRALDNKPVTAAELRAVLAEGEVLLQAFATHESTWTWFVIDGKRLEAVRTPPLGEPALPEAVAALLGTTDAVVYVDLGGTYAPPASRLTVSGKPLPRTSEALSATYLAAAVEAASLARQPPITFAEPTVTRIAAEGMDSMLLRFGAAVVAEEPARSWPGASQLTFARPEGAPESESVDLDRLAGLDLGGAAAWVDTDPPSPRVTRSVAQAFLFAGIPTIISGRVLGSRIMDGLATDALATTLAAAREAGELGEGTRLVGYRGMSFDERVDLAFVRLLGLARAAGPDYQAATKSQRREDWERAEGDFAALVDIVELLMTPEAVPVLAASKRPGAAALAKALPTRLLDMRDKLAQTRLALGDVDGAAALQGSLAESYTKAGAYENALEQLLAMGKAFMSRDRNHDAIRVLERCAELAKGQKLQLVEADCRSRLGSAYRGLFDNANARKAYGDAVTIYAALKHKNQIYPRRYLGLLHETALNDYDEALAQYRLALADAQTFSEKGMVPPLHLDMARTYRARGDFGLALEEVARARAAIAEGDTVDQTEASLEAAKIEWYRGDYPAALEQQSAALSLARATRNDFQEIQALSVGGLIAMNRGDLTAAHEALSGALDLARGSGRRREEAAQLDNIGNVLQRAGRLDEAEARFREALSLDTLLGSTEGQAFDLRALAAVLERRGKVNESLSTVEQALSASRAIGSRYNEAQCLFVRGRALLAAHRDEEAGKSFAAARELAIQLSLPEVAWRASYALGRIAEAAGNVREARSAYDAALEVAERLSRAGDEGGTEESRDTLYADAVTLALDQHDEPAAFTLIERMHARALLDLVAASDVVFPNDEARDLVAAERRAREAVIGAERDVKRNAEGAPARLERARGEHDAALAALRGRYPGVARAFTIAPRPLAEAQAALGASTAVVLYLVGQRTSEALVVQRDRLTRIGLHVSRDELRELTDSYREALRAFGSLDTTGIRISATVLMPLEDTLRGVRHLVVVPHGSLVGIPFAALPWATGQLVDVMTTSYAPSVSALVDTLSRPQRQQPKRVLAAAHGSDLPFARLEALAVAGKGALLGPNASETAVRALRADAVDLAAHGDLARGEPMRAGLALGSTDSDDGHLELREVFGMPALAPLVSLSACALGGSDAAWSAVASAFFASGTQTLVASQERVSDLAAGVLMKRFYRERAKSGGEALRAAQLWTRSYFAHPAHWATFALIGDFR